MLTGFKNCQCRSPFRRLLSSLTETEIGLLKADRQEMETDVLIVGGGPAGLAAAIRLKQLSPERSVTVLEKASEVGNKTSEIRI